MPFYVLMLSFIAGSPGHAQPAYGVKAHVKFMLDHQLEPIASLTALRDEETKAQPVPAAICVRVGQLVAHTSKIAELSQVVWIDDLARKVATPSISEEAVKNAWTINETASQLLPYCGINGNKVSDALFNDFVKSVIVQGKALSAQLK